MSRFFGYWVMGTSRLISSFVGLRCGLTSWFVGLVVVFSRYLIRVAAVWWLWLGFGGVVARFDRWLWCGFVNCGSCGLDWWLWILWCGLGGFVIWFWVVRVLICRDCSPYWQWWWWFWRLFCFGFGGLQFVRTVIVGCCGYGWWWLCCGFRGCDGGSNYGVVVVVVVYCGYIILLWCLYYFNWLNVKVKPLILGVLLNEVVK